MHCAPHIQFAIAHLLHKVIHHIIPIIAHLSPCGLCHFSLGSLTANVLFLHLRLLKTLIILPPVLPAWGRPSVLLRISFLLRAAWSLLRLTDRFGFSLRTFWTRLLTERALADTGFSTLSSSSPPFSGISLSSTTIHDSSNSGDDSELVSGHGPRKIYKRSRLTLIEPCRYSY